MGWEQFRIDTSPDFDVTIEPPDPAIQYHPAFYQHPNATQHYLFAPHPKPIFAEQLEAAGFSITKVRITEEPVVFIGKWAIALQGDRVVVVDPNGFKWWRVLTETEEEAVASVRKLLTFGNPVNSKFKIVNSKLKAAKASKVFVGERFSYREHFNSPPINSSSSDILNFEFCILNSLAATARRIKGSAIALVRRTFADLIQLGHSLWDLKFDCIAQLGAEGKQAFKDWLSEDFGGSKYLADAAMKLAPWYESLSAKTQRLVSLNVHEWSVAALKELTKLTGKALDLLQKSRSGV